jgi:23S rRNA (uracil1939-C5)-methyltransferase
MFRHMTYEEELWAKRAAGCRTRWSASAALTVTVEEILGGGTARCTTATSASIPWTRLGTVGFYRRPEPSGGAGEASVPPSRQPAGRRGGGRPCGTGCAEYRVPGYDERTGKGLLRHVYVRTNREGESLCCAWWSTGRRFPRRRS